jgi:hypothetical protein
MEICGICELDHPTKLCPSFPGLKEVFKGSNEETKKAYFISKKPWQAHLPGMPQDPSFPFNNWNHMYNTQIPQQIQYPSNPWKFPNPPQT